MIIALSGCDGSGKSTIIEEILKEIDSQELKITVINEFDYLLLKPIASMLKRHSEVHTSFLEGKPRIRPLTFIWAHLVYLDTFIRALLYKLRHKNVIFDRYFIDYGIGFYNLTGRSYFIRLFNTGIRADLSIYCYADATTLHKRRLQQKRKKSFYVKQLDTYHKYGSFDEKIDTATLKESKQKIKKIVRIYEK